MLSTSAASSASGSASVCGALPSGVPSSSGGVAGWFRMLAGPNQPYTRMRLAGLDPDLVYNVTVRRVTERPFGQFGGDELMYAGLITTNGGSGEVLEGDGPGCDFDSRIYILERVQE